MVVEKKLGWVKKNFAFSQNFCVAVKVALTQAIHFSSLTALRIYITINAGAELALTTPLTTAASVSFF